MYVLGSGLVSGGGISDESMSIAVDRQKSGNHTETRILRSCIYDTSVESNSNKA